MTLSVICDDNLKGMQYSFVQSGRLHTYNGFRVEDIRKVGRHFQLLFANYGEASTWKTVDTTYNLRTEYSESEYAAGIAAR
jgi:hypothetical protein